MQRALTGTYDLAGMKAFQELEKEVNDSLAVLFGCDADDLPIDVDVYSIYGRPAEERKGLLARTNI